MSGSCNCWRRLLSCPCPGFCFEEREAKRPPDGWMAIEPKSKAKEAKRDG